MAYNKEQLQDQHYVNGQVLEKLENIEKRFDAKDTLCEVHRKEIDKIKRIMYICIGTGATVSFLLYMGRDIAIFLFAT
jgi:hypothetical protein